MSCSSSSADQGIVALSAWYMCHFEQISRNCLKTLTVTTHNHRLCQVNQDWYPQASNQYFWQQLFKCLCLLWKGSHIDKCTENYHTVPLRSIQSLFQLSVLAFFYSVGFTFTTLNITFSSHSRPQIKRSDKLTVPAKHQTADGQI